MRITLLIGTILISLTSCNSGKKENTPDLNTENSMEENASVNREASQNVADSQGYFLMQQKCYICHFERPEPSKSNQMIAPPMLMVQQHYKPAYPNKEDFINAVVAIIQDPSQENTLMPGAVKKFNIMPKLIYEEAELRLIAEAMYDYDFGAAPKMNMQNMLGNLQLNNGEKWVLKKESMAQINAIIKKINNFNSSDVSDYNQMGKEIFNDAKILILDDSYSGELFDQIHIFFGGIETNMHALIAAKSKAEGDKELTELKARFKEFHNYFE